MVSFYHPTNTISGYMTLHLDEQDLKKPVNKQFYCLRYLEVVYR